MGSVPQLAALLDELVAFLEDRGEHWADAVAASAREVEAGDAHGARRFLQLHGGMGSMNDLVFHPLNNNATEDEDLDLINTRLQELDTRARRLATELLRDCEQST